MESVGKILAEARIAKGISLEKVSEAISIRPDYLEALENDDYSKLPEEVFVKGFIRNYGNFLGLQGPELVDLYKANKASLPVEEVKSQGVREVDKVSLNISLKQERSIGSGTGKFEIPRPQLPWKQLALGAVVVVVLAGGYFTLPSLVDKMPSISFSSSTQEEKPQQAPVQPAVKVYDHVVVEMTATDKCWLEVYENNKEVYSGLLQPGDKHSFEGAKQLVIKYGNVGAMQVVFNGQPQDMQGEQGVVVKTYTL